MDIGEFWRHQHLHIGQLTTDNLQADGRADTEHDTGTGYWVDIITSHTMTRHTTCRTPGPESV